jgi:hypothetical protein
MSRWFVSLATALALVQFSSGGVAQTPAPSAPPPATPGMSLSAITQVPASGPPIMLEAGKGTLIRLTAPAATVFVANPDIADVQVKSPSLIYVSAKAPGETVIVFILPTLFIVLMGPAALGIIDTFSRSGGGPKHVTVVTHNGSGDDMGLNPNETEVTEKQAKDEQADTKQKKAEEPH